MLGENTYIHRWLLAGHKLSQKYYAADKISIFTKINIGQYII